MLLIRRNRSAKLIGKLFTRLPNRGHRGFHSQVISAFGLIGFMGVYTMSKVLVIAVIATAVAVSACRREMPHPNGLGAASIAASQTVVK